MAEKREIEITLKSRGAKRNADNLNKSVKGVGQSADDAQFSMNNLSLAAAAVSAALAAGKVLQYAEAWQKVNNQLKLVTDSTNDLLSTQDSLVSLAQETRAGLSGTVTLYAKLDRATKELNVSESDLLTTVKAINQAFIISGATAVEAENAIIQLAQGLQSGSLSGDEFNSVAEQAPRLLEALSAELGKNTKELKDLGSQGKLTSELIINSLLNQSDVIDEEFGKTTTLVSQGWKNLTDAVTVAIGAIDDATGISESLGVALDATAVLITNVSTGMNEIGRDQVILEHFERWQSLLNLAGIELDFVNNKITEYSGRVELAKTSATTFNEIIKDQAIDVNNLAAGYASLDQIFAGLDLFNLEGAVTNIKPETTEQKKSPAEQISEPTNTSFIDNLKAETRALQAELIIRQQLRDGFITETQAQQMLERQNILVDYDARRELILEKEFENETARQEALAILREQELIALQNFEAQKTSIKQDGDNQRLALEAAYNKSVESQRLSLFSSSVGLLKQLTNESKLAAIAGIAIQTATAFAANKAATASAATLAYSSQLIPGDPTSVARAAAASAAAYKLGAINGALILGAGALQGIGAVSGGGGSGVGAVSAPTVSASTSTALPPPQVQSQQQERVVNITGLENFRPDDLIPLTKSQLEQYLGTDENVNIAINTGQRNAARVGAI